MKVERVFDWTKQEKSEYKPRDYKPLQRLYREANIPRTKPTARADYLAHKVLNFKYADELGMLVVLDEKTKAEALNYLEDLVIQKHIWAIERKKAIKNKIPAPMVV